MVRLAHVSSSRIVRSEPPDDSSGSHGADVATRREADRALVCEVLQRDGDRLVEATGFRRAEHGDLLATGEGEESKGCALGTTAAYPAQFGDGRGELGQETGRSRRKRSASSPAKIIGPIGGTTVSQADPRYVAAAVQATPVFLDRDATVAKASRLVGEAAAAGARLVVFPEVFVAGYPYWLWGDRPAVVPGLEQKGFAALWKAAIEVPGPETERLGEAARAAGAVVVIGINERESAYGRATLYNTLLTFGDDGRLLGRHRKLVPTYKERTVWGAGDGSTLAVQATPIGRLGGLICWENFMPLARYHQYAQGTQVYVAATADDSPSWQALMRTIAAEGRVYVISVCQPFARSRFPDEPLLGGFGPEDDVLSVGNSLIVAPGGEVLAGPLTGEEGILTAEIDLGRVVEEKHSLDVAGHYARPDVFRLIVEETPALPYQRRES